MITKTLTAIAILLLANTTPTQSFAKETKKASKPLAQQIARPPAYLGNITPIQTNEPKLQSICVPASVCINGIRIDSLKERPPITFATPKLNR